MSPDYAIDRLLENPHGGCGGGFLENEWTPDRLPLEAAVAFAMKSNLELTVQGVIADATR